MIDKNRLQLYNTIITCLCKIVFMKGGLYSDQSVTEYNIMLQNLWDCGFAVYRSAFRNFLRYIYAMRSQRRV